MLFHCIVFVALILLTDSKAIIPLNVTKNVKKITTDPTETLISETTTVLTTTTTTLITTTAYQEETTTTISTNPNELNKPYEFESNFTRNNDSVFIYFHSNVSDTFASINNTFTSIIYDNQPFEILFNEHSNHWNHTSKTTIIMNFDRSLTREMAIHLGDRLVDIVDLSTTIQSMNHQNRTKEAD